MKHKTLYRVSHLSMLLNFIMLVITGVMRFVLPFSLTVTRVHILCGFAITVLIGFHIIGRLKQMRTMVKGRDGFHHTPVILTLVICGVYWSAAWFAWPGAKEIVNLSYESRNKNIILRERENIVGNAMKDSVYTFKLATEKSSVDVVLDWTPAGIDSRKSIAIWAETKSGSMIETLYVSEDLRFSEDTAWEGQQIKRGEILPIWRNRYTAVSGIGPDGLQDAVSGPTKNHQFDLKNNLTGGEAFAIYVEINAADDEQPSVLYVALIDPESTNSYTLLSLLGTGEGAFKSGEINYELEKISSAKGLVEKILVHSRWEK